MYVKGGHNLITHQSTYTKIVTFFSARVTCPLHLPCASVRPSEKRKKLRLFCRVTRSSRAWTICMEKNWLRNENWQNVNSCFSRSIAYFSCYHQNDPIFLYHLFETSISTRNANVHIDKLITSFSFERISCRNISHSRNLSHDNFRCPPLHSKTCLMDLCNFPL